MSANRRDKAIPRHLAIIMDGNGRWVQGCGLPRSAGHEAGVQSTRRIIEASGNLGIQVLTLYTFSTENWSLPAKEVDYMMYLVEKYAQRELRQLQWNGVRIQLMGKREGLPTSVLKALDRRIEQTQDNSRLTFYLALNYGGRAEIVDAIKSIVTAQKQGALEGTNLDESTLARYLYCPECPDVDLLIRTGGEWQLSNFLLWRAAHAIFWSTPVFWPDFQYENLKVAIGVYVEQLSEYKVDS